MGAVAAASLLKFGARLVENPLAPASVYAHVIRLQERRIKDPRPMLVRILEADPFVQVFVFGHHQRRVSADDIRTRKWAPSNS